MYCTYGISPRRLHRPRDLHAADQWTVALPDTVSVLDIERTPEDVSSLRHSNHALSLVVSPPFHSSSVLSCQACFFFALIFWQPYEHTCQIRIRNVSIDNQCVYMMCRMFLSPAPVRRGEAVLRTDGLLARYPGAGRLFPKHKKLLTHQQDVLQFAPFRRHALHLLPAS